MFAAIPWGMRLETGSGALPHLARLNSPLSTGIKSTNHATDAFEAETTKMLLDLKRHVGWKLSDHYVVCHTERFSGLGSLLFDLPYIQWWI